MPNNEFTPAENSPGTSTTANADATQTVSRPAIRLFGIGSAGIQALSSVAEESGRPIFSVAIHTDAHGLAGSNATEKYQLEAKIFRGLGSGGDPERGRAAAEEHIDALKQLCAGAKVIILVAGLGGGAGSGIAPVLAKAAKEAGAFVLVFAALPFECEGLMRNQTARLALERLQAAADLVITQSNQKAIPLIDPSTSLTDTFRITNGLLASSVLSAWRGLSTDPVMGLKFIDICDVVRQRSRDCNLVVATASGSDRAKTATGQVLGGAMLGGPDGLKTAETVGVILMADASLTMMEVNLVMERIRQECGAAPFMMGACIVPEQGAALRVALLTGRSQIGTHPSGASDPEVSLPVQRATDSDIEALGDGIRSSGRPVSRFIAPAPATTPERLDQLRKKKKPLSRMRQGQLPLEIVSKGRFEKSEPTIHQGEDLDIPTYIRRHVSLN